MEGILVGDCFGDITLYDVAAVKECFLSTGILINSEVKDPSLAHCLYPGVHVEPFYFLIDVSLRNLGVGLRVIREVGILFSNEGMDPLRLRLPVLFDLLFPLGVPSEDVADLLMDYLCEGVFEEVHLEDALSKETSDLGFGDGCNIAKPFRQGLNLGFFEHAPVPHEDDLGDTEGGG